MANNFRFKIKYYDKHCRAKAGELITTCGIIKTPAFVPVGTAATIKTLTPDEISACNIDVFFVNTYHMLFRPGIEVIKKLGGLHSFMNWKGPILTDSGGFQSFSLGEGGPRRINRDKPLVKINRNGIKFKSFWDGRELIFSPKDSIRAQINLDSNLMMSFDECTFYPISKDRAREAMNRTHNWALDCLNEKKNIDKKKLHAIYGIVQGSVFKDLRIESASFISSLPFDGYAIGSVANSREPREKVFAVLDWTLPILLGYKKPIHFLGIGEIEDIFISIEKGIDSLDCVTPTRLARMGWIFTKKAGLENKFRYDITKSTYSTDRDPPEKGCLCFTCKNFSRAYLNHLFRVRELLSYRLATIHNLYFFGNLMEKIREAISTNSLMKLKQDWLG